MVSIGIVGGTGYTGVELLRILLRHASADVRIITSRSESGTRVVDYFPSLRGKTDLVFTDQSIKQLSQCDVVFFATPHGVAMEQARSLIEAGTKVIDLAADFRIKNLMNWKKWYKLDHRCPDLLDEAVYGLPELNREKIKSARIVANPGCYATSIELALIPLIKSGVVDHSNIIADAKSGVSGAGRKADIGVSFSEVSENFKAYGVSGHRHHPEIEEVLTGVSQSGPVNLQFTPHLLPQIRGILATVYARLENSDRDVRSIFSEAYENEPFVEVLPEGEFPDTKSTRGTNSCKLGLHIDVDFGRVVIISALDNLVKGAAGQAVQNMNIMMGLDEQTGLLDLATVP